MSLAGKIVKTAFSGESSKRHKDDHRTQILDNLSRWASKPVLQEVYRDFYKLIAKYARHDLEGRIVELGSGMSKIKEVIPPDLPPSMCPHPKLGCSRDGRIDDHRCGWSIA